ncbi:P-loop NTPase fold protein [Hyphomonas sp.]|uniref:P-loop NTPase fold protein n=1 Tax=Hyphomonas sp. TaxID=87 RepID=UPI0025B85C4A|nr:P-loop NTPase fold protein [Hyphomonas sp.]
MEHDHNLIDRALTDPKHDLLERDSFVKGLTRALVREVSDPNGNIIGRESTSYVVGLTGEWGLGKSTVLNFVYSELETLDHVSVALFNPWIFNGRDELLNGFFSVLRESFKKSQVEQMREVQAALDDYWVAIGVLGDGVAAAADAAGASGGASGIWSWFYKTFRPGQPKVLSPLRQREILEEKLRASKQAVVVLIDELDRIEDDEVRAVAQLVKAVGDIQGISYLVSYDERRVVDALGRGCGEERFVSGSRYLEKIIQYPVPIRPIFSGDAKVLLQASLAANKNSDFSWDDVIKDEIFQTILRGLVTPRDVKRLIGSYSILHETVRGELRSLDVLAYCWILVKAPLLRNAIASNIEKLVDDPSSEDISIEMLRKELDGKSESVVDILGREAAAYSDLLPLLFPRFGKERSSEAFNGDRLSKRENLIRMLYLGNPPDLMPRKSIELLWRQEEPQAITSILKEHIQANTIRNLISRLEDVFESLPEHSDSKVWCCLSDVLVRSTDWISEPEESGNVASEAAEILVRLGLRTPALKVRVQRIIESLIAHGDLVFTAFVIRRLGVHFGFVEDSTRERVDEHIFGREDAKKLIYSEVARYRIAILDGFALRRLPTLSAIFAVSNLNRWDEELRNSFTQQLKRPEAICTFSALAVPPGYVIERTSLDNLMHADEIQSYLTGLGPPLNWIENDWIAMTVRRLVRILEGKSTWHLDDEDPGFRR